MEDPTERPPSDEETPAPEVPLDAPEADVLDQERPWDPAGPVTPPSIPIDAPEADVLEQSRPVDLDDDERQS